MYRGTLARGHVVYLRSDGKRLPYIALVEDVDAASSEFSCRWFYRYSEMKFPDSVRKMKGVTAELQNELFLSTCTDTNFRESVLGRCTVLTFSQFEELGKPDQLFCRYLYNTTKISLTKLEKIPWSNEGIPVLELKPDKVFDAEDAADRVRSMIAKLRITQGQVCTQAGVPQSWLSNWLRGQDTNLKSFMHQHALLNWLSEVSESSAACVSPACGMGEQNGYSRARAAEPYDMIGARRVRALIETLGITQGQVASQADVPQSWFSVWLRGTDPKFTPRPTTKHQKNCMEWYARTINCSESTSEGTVIKMESASADTQTTGLSALEEDTTERAMHGLPASNIIEGTGVLVEHTTEAAEHTAIIS